MPKGFIGYYIVNFMLGLLVAAIAYLAIAFVGWDWWVPSATSWRLTFVTITVMAFMETRKDVA